MRSLFPQGDRPGPSHWPFVGLMALPCATIVIGAPAGYLSQGARPEKGTSAHAADAGAEAGARPAPATTADASTTVRTAEENACPAEDVKSKKTREVAKLASMVRSGKRERLSKALLRIEALEENLKRAAEGQPCLSGKDLQRRYSDIVREGKKAILGKGDPKEALHRFAHSPEVLREYYFGSGTLVDVLERRSANCLSATLLFSALLEDVAKIRNYKLLYFDDHVKTLVGSVAIENTEWDWDDAHSPFDGCGMADGPKVLIVGYLLDAGVPLSSLPSAATTPFQRQPPRFPKHCNRPSKKPSGGRPSHFRLPPVGVFSGLQVPDHPIPNPHLNAIPAEQVMAMGAFLAEILRRYDHAAPGPRSPQPLADDVGPPSDAGIERRSPPQRRLIEIEFDTQHQAALTNLRVPEQVDLGLLIEEFDYWFARGRDLREGPALAQRDLHCRPLRRIPPDVLPQIAAANADRFGQYSKEALCRRYARAAANGSPEGIVRFFPYTFCLDVKEALRASYLRHQSSAALHNLAYMAHPEDYQYFAKELAKASDGGTAEKAATGLVFADRERGCRLLRERAEKSKMPVIQFYRTCEQFDAAWAAVESTETTLPELMSALAALDGRGLTPPRADRLKAIASNADSWVALRAARVLDMGGHSATARAVLSSALDGLKSTDEYARCCGYPRGFLRHLIALLEKDPWYAIALAREARRHDCVKLYETELVSALCEVVKSGDGDGANEGGTNSLDDRIEAALELARLRAQMGDCE